jgi:hypothetical protein
LSENLDLVRSICADWEGGDFSRDDWADPEIEFVIPYGLSPAETTGIGEMRDRFVSWLAPWRDYRIEVERNEELEDGRVLVVMRLVGVGKTSGLEIGRMAAKGALIFTVRSSKVVRLVNYSDAERALADLAPEQ